MGPLDLQDVSLQCVGLLGLQLWDTHPSWISCQYIPSTIDEKNMFDSWIQYPFHNKQTNSYKSIWKCRRYVEWNMFHNSPFLSRKTKDEYFPLKVISCWMSKQLVSVEDRVGTFYADHNNCEGSWDNKKFKLCNILDCNLK